MKRIMDLMRTRRSVRTFSDRPIDEIVLSQLQTFMEGMETPFKVPVRLVLLSAEEYGLSSPVISGGEYYIGIAVEENDHCWEAAGYALEQVVLYAWSLGFGTTWLGGTMNRGVFERAMGLREQEIMPAVTPIGYPAEKMSLRETVMRKGCKADERKPFEEMFFEGDFHTPLSKQRAGKLTEVLEAVRMAPSAVNRQPWRLLVTDDAVHFYGKKWLGGVLGDMQKIDLGIALCHFALAAEECHMNIEFCISEPLLTEKSDLEYIATYLLK